MNDLISRSALKKALEEDMKDGGIKTDEFDKGYDLGIEKAIEMLDNAPTVEQPNLIAERARSYQNGYTAGYHNGLRIGIGLPPPIAEKTLDQLTGEWIFDGEHWRCSSCKETPWYDGSPMACGYKFCPICGSPMKGDMK